MPSGGFSKRSDVPAQQRNGFHTSYVMTQKLDRIQHAHERHLQTHAAVPCTEDLADAVGIGARELERLHRVQRQPLSIDCADDKIGSRTLAELLADPRQECPSDRLDQPGLERRIDESFRDLDVREQQVLRMRYGLHGQQPQTLSDIGKVLRVTRERIRQIEAGAMSKLRQPEHAARFVQFFQDSSERLMNAAARLQRSNGLGDGHGNKSIARR